ncbi:MAG: 2Fe-2S iron-sulfur cluster-binding protein [Betaproteobacteria bacterium]
MTAFRLPKGGEAIDRAKPLNFTFDGRPLQGFEGDTLASALLANDVVHVGRSFKYHRLRGILSAGSEESNALVAVGEGGRMDTNTRATMVELYDGLGARSLNRWPSLGFDLGAVNNLLSRFLVAGFYYKTFIRPRALWHAVYEPFIRRMAGIGEAPREPDPERYDKVHRHCEVLVVGGGRSGRKAAAEAARGGGRVILCDEGRAAPIPGVQVLERATVFGYYDDNFLCAVQRDARRQTRLWHFRAGEVVLATGAHERPIVFGDNDRPGVMLASAVEIYLRKYAVAPGKRIVVFTNNDSGHARAKAFREFGLDAGVVDSRKGVVVEKAVGGRRVTGARLSDGTTKPCDVIAMAGGWSPAVHLYSQAQGRLRWDEKKLCFVPDGCRQRVRVVGKANGEFDFGIAALWEIEAEKAFVDFQNDVTSRDVRLAAREGFRSVEHFKRYTTTGMAPDQGKTSSINAMAILADATGRTIQETGTTVFRPPYTPVSYGVLAGRDLGDLLDPIRVTPMHDWHAANRAAFENVDQWKRPWYYGSDMHAAVQREALAVRKALGVLDASTLGKIDIQGRDAARFLDRIYTGSFSTLGVGKARYGLMCREDGMIFDDGVTTRLGENHFHMTTTTGGAARVLDWLEEYLQTEWPELEVYCTSVTEQWATVAVAGPRAGQLMKDLGWTDEMPFMTCKDGSVAGLEARVFRISFTGELSYEINVEGRDGLRLWETVMDAGRQHGVTPYGTETMHLLRAEKGFIIVGQETDGTVTPLDLGLDWAVKKSGDFVGRRSLSRADTQRADRKQLVGLLPENPNEVLPEGAQITERALALPQGHGSAPVPMAGHVTSSYMSPNLGRSFALALVKSGRSRIGADVFIPLEGRAAKARIVKPVFL